MPEKIHAIDDVFGVSRDVPLNYVEREAVDGKLLDSLTRSHHIVIYGSSKQGKTCLRKHSLNADDYITVACQNKWGLSELHGAILKTVGYEVKQSESKTVSGTNKVALKFGLNFLLGKAEAGTELQEGEDATETRSELEIDPSDANDVIRALNEIKFDKYVAIEDFHYLPDETQRDFSFALKTFHEQSSFCFIITGVWREQNRLIAFNGDLTQRVFSVDVDTWTEKDLISVITEGETLLNVQFSDDFKSAAIAGANESVHIVQECCRRMCRRAQVFETQTNHNVIGNGDAAREIIKEIVDEQTGRYNGFILNFADGFQQTELEMPKWIIYAILKSSIVDLEKGLRLRPLSALIKVDHPRGQELNNGNITQTLNSVGSLQRNKGIRPIIIDYDGTNRNLHVVDKGFLLWLENQNIDELIEDLEIPI